MSAISLCGNPSATLTTITSGCLNIGQPHKLIFQKLYSTGTTRNEIVVGTDDPTLLATWTDLKAATDNTKVVVTPAIWNFQNEAGAKVDFSEGSPDKIKQTVFVDPGTMSFNLPKLNAAAISSVKALIGHELQFFIINHEGKIVGQVDSQSSPTKFYGFDLTNFWVSGRVLGGLDALDRNDVSFEVEDGWADNIYAYTPATGFNPKKAL